MIALIPNRCRIDGFWGGTNLVLLYDTIHVVSFRKITLISATGTHDEIIKSLKNMY